MNNEQFRRLVAANTPKPSTDSNGGASPGAATPRGVSLGSRQRSSIPMTPRSVGLHKSDFARQLAEQNTGNNQSKKFKSYDPKGSKLAEGYVDRARNRTSEEEDERAARIKALEESLKNEEIDQETFDKLRAQIAGGDLSSTHLVKGLDFKLLERVRKGENVYGEDGAKEASPEKEDDFDEEFEQLEEKEIAAVKKEKTVKKGQLSTAPLNPSKKRTRDQILAEMKAAREAAKAKEDTGLGAKFKKIGAKTPGTRIERDSKGREVLIVVDEDGHEKRKVRKIQPDAEAEGPPAKPADLMPDKSAKPLGMEVPEQYRKQVEEPEDEDINIFDDVGDDYDPLAGLEEEDSEDEETTEKKVQPSDAEKKDNAAMPPPPPPATTTEPRNYFKDSKTGLVSSESLKAPSFSDPAIQAAIKKAASMKPISRSSEEEDAEAKAKEERLKKLLQSNDRDAEDMDLGFGTSRFEDEEDFEEKKVKLSEWGREDGEGSHGGGGGSKRKRGPKKRKGDVNNAADVLRVMEKQKAATK
ncbi:hypothetical protein F4776DRAFT_660324 [Hypoxylon sp. NC0597]|nr:hypothetical protein F4776DRAFT_660324 [Hypoxylon sp. NC0597]